MSTKAELKRVRNSLERERNNVRADALEVERRRLAAVREREQLVGFLRLFCERYGDNDWADETSLLEIVRDHLAIPLNAKVDTLLERLAELQQAARHVDPQPTAATVVRAASQPVREPQRAIAEPAANGHAWHLVSDRDLHRAVCTCSYRSPLYDKPITADQAGRIHARSAPPLSSPQETRRHA